MSVDYEKIKDILRLVDAKPENKPFKRKIVWFNTIGFLILHLAAVYASFLVFTTAMLRTSIWTTFLMMATSQGVTLGAHRMYTHRAVKGTTSMRFILVALQTIAGQNCLYIWVRDHRQHHKYSDTDADPHNASRGFFFSHVGWLMSRKHPDVIEKGKTIDMSDLEADAIVMFQKRYYKTLYFILALVFPIAVPCYFWQETLWNSFFVSFIFRMIIVLNFTWLVNSAAHAYGNRPFNKNIIPVETGLVSFLTMGEGWHNYHHTFPWDYRASEHGQNINFTTQVIDFLAKYGWLYDLKQATPEMVTNRILKHGDGTHPKLQELTSKTAVTQESDVEEDQLFKFEDNHTEKAQTATREKQRPKGVS